MAAEMKTAAFVKMFLHAAKYPHSAVNGVFLKQKEKASKNQIVDCIPLFHLHLTLLPMLEVALNQIEAYCSQNQLEICGYYHIHSHISDTHKNLLIQKIVERISEHYGSAYLFMVDNCKLNNKTEPVPYTVHESKDGRLVDGPKVPLEAGAAELAMRFVDNGEYEKLVDFDNHLDNLALDWRNIELNC